MRLANVGGRATIMISDDHGVDVHRASGERFGPELSGIYENWDQFLNWADDASLGEVAAVSRDQLGAPSPSPRQIVAIGLNFQNHAVESGFEAPTQLPPVFTKFLSSLTGPYTTVSLPPGGNTDWEVEVVAVISRVASGVSPEHAWDHVAGLTVGQDISERVTQLRPPAPQFSLGKSFAGFAPTGPWLVTPDEVVDRDDLELGCSINGGVVQTGRTRDLIFSIPRLVSELSQTMTLYPGDLIFTGTPEGVGLGRNPQQFLQDGDVLVSWVAGIGNLEQRFEASPR